MLLSWEEQFVDFLFFPFLASISEICGPVYLMQLPERNTKQIRTVCIITGCSSKCRRQFKINLIMYKRLIIWILYVDTCNVIVSALHVYTICKGSYKIFMLTRRANIGCFLQACDLHLATVIPGIYAEHVLNEVCFIIEACSKYPSARNNATILG